MTKTTKPATAKQVRAALHAAADPERARSSMRFFKTGPGQYGEGDRFVGVTVPAQRAIARAHRGLPLAEIEALLASAIHEERLTALLILVDTAARGDGATKQACYDLYLRNLKWVNNWDLVDSSAPAVVGDHLRDRDRRILRKLARSSNLWERRVAMIATLAFIRAGETEDAFAIARLLLDDTHDLMHKAVGWMLREVGKYVGKAPLVAFLEAHAAEMPRTALRYAIEHFPEAERKAWREKKPQKTPRK
ncbi:MAG: DNA alkylation repair protein [Byssovorax sp.]